MEADTRKDGDFCRDALEVPALRIEGKNRATVGSEAMKARGTRVNVFETKHSEVCDGQNFWRCFRDLDFSDCSSMLRELVQMPMLDQRGAKACIG